jgi:phosphodiesterase/alkaline phosphatase D-like protein
VKRHLGMAAVFAVALAALPATASAAKFQYGVASAEATSSSIVLWTRAPKTGKVTVQVAPDRRFSAKNTKRKSQSAKASHDNTVRIKVTRLKGSETYYYRFRQGKSKSAIGSFITAPKASNTKAFRFSYSGDASAQPAQGQTAPFFGSFQVYGQMARERNAFNINLGDTIYSDPEVPNIAPALTLQQKWAMYKQNIALANLQKVRSQTSMFNQWDDHEFINDFTPPENGSAIYKAGASAFRDYMPAGFKAGTGLYRRARWGRNAELFFLDERSFRSAKASANHLCDNPDTGQPDFAPTAPQSTRDTFALVVPSLARPVSQACLDKINDPNQSLLGKGQLARFQADIKKSTAKWKIIVNEVPIQQFYALPYDRWEGYAFERNAVLTTLSGLKNVVVLTTDTHANLYNDARFQTLEQGGPKNSGVTEMVTGPVGTRTFNEEIDEATGKKGNGDLATNLFFKPPPPNGVGMKCYQTDAFSYTQVQVSGQQLVLRPKDQTGKALKNPDNSACGPFTLTAK